MQTFETLIEREFIKRVEARITNLSEQVAAGMVEDFPKYKLMCGQINGLRLAMDILAEANNAAKQENR